MNKLSVFDQKDKFSKFRALQKWDELLNIYEQFDQDLRFLKIYIKDAIYATIELGLYDKTKEIIESIKKRKDILDRYEIELYISDTISKYMENFNLKMQYDNTKKIFLKLYEHIPASVIKSKNTVLNEYEIANSNVYLKSYPREIRLTVTTKCNLKCIMCNPLNHDGKYEISDKEFYDLLEILPYVEVLVIQGGEVLYYDKFDILLQEIIKNNVIVYLHTNGLLLKKEIIEKLTSCRANIVFSIDSPNKATYESIRVGANYHDLLKNLEMFNKIRSEKSSNIAIGINMIIMKRNFHQIEDMIEFAHKYQFSNLTLFPMQGALPSNEENIFEFENNSEILKELSDKREHFENLANNHGLYLMNRLPDFKDKENSKKNNIKKCAENESVNCSENKSGNNFSLFCTAPFKKIYLDTNNRYLPHCMCFEKKPKEFNYSDIKYYNSENSIMAKWNSDLMALYRMKILNNQQNLICSSDCLNNKRILGKDILKL